MANRPEPEWVSDCKGRPLKRHFKPSNNFRLDDEKMTEKELSFEQGPIRPPSEARSLLLRVTRNCPWNQCLFCRTYKKRKFSLRTVEEIKQDIQTARDISDDIRDLD